MDAVAGKAGGAKVRPDDVRRERLAGLGRVVEKVSDLKAVVQRDAGGTWFLQVGTSYTEGPFTIVLCDMVAGVWEFGLPDGARIGPAGDVESAALRVRAEARGVPLRTAEGSL